MTDIILRIPKPPATPGTPLSPAAQNRIETLHEVVDSIDRATHDTMLEFVEDRKMINCGCEISK